LEACGLPLCEEHSAVRLQVGVDHHSWKVEEANGHGRSLDVEEVFSQTDGVNEELKLEKVVARWVCMCHI